MKPDVYENRSRKIRIAAKKIELGVNWSLGRNIHINVRGVFRLGDRSRIGDNAFIEGKNVIIGSDLWSSSREFGGLTIGRGRKNWPDANLTIGDRCTVHNNSIDLSKSVTLGNDVGLSPDVTIYTHGYWLSPLEGFPVKFGPVTIEDGVIVGYRSLILMGVTIGARAVIAAQSVVTKSLKGNAVYAGNPARKVKEITPLSDEEKTEFVVNLIEEYKRVAEYRGLNPATRIFYPWIKVNNAYFNLETLAYRGEEDEQTDDFRDFVFHNGLRFYTKRPFKTSFKEK